MKYMEWNQANIKQQINILQDLENKNGKCDLSIQIEQLTMLIKDTLTYFSIDDNFKYQMEIEITSINMFAEFINDIKYFSELYRLLNYKNIKPIDTYSLKDSTILGFTHDFYNHLDKEFASIFNRLYRERKNNFKFSKKRSGSFYIQELNYHYINVERDNTVDDFLNTGHEYAHGIVDNLFPRNYFESNYPFIEFFPLFIEFLMGDELNKTFMDLEKDILYIRATTIHSCLNYAKEIILEARYLAQLDIIKNKNETINDLAKFGKIGKGSAKKIFNKPIMERLLYVTSFLTAIELYYLYLIDPELSIYISKEIIKIDKVNSYNEFLVNNGIILNDNTKKLIIETNKQLKRMN